MGKSFAIFSITTFTHSCMVFQLCKTATSIATKASRSSRKFSVKLSLASTEESTLLTHVCANFTLSRMTMQEELQLKWVQDETDPHTLTASLLASSASYFLISGQKLSRFFVVEYFSKFFMVSTFNGAKV